MSDDAGEGQRRLCGVLKLVERETKFTERVGKYRAPPEQFLRQQARALRSSCLGRCPNLGNYLLD